MAKSVTSFKPNQESVVLLENSTPIESANKHLWSEDHIQRIMEPNTKLNIASH